MCQEARNKQQMSKGWHMQLQCRESRSSSDYRIGAFCHLPVPVHTTL
jgi:hypothetical protein